MIIDFNSMSEKAIPGFKGGNKDFNVKMFSDARVKIMHGRLEPGASIGYHCHETSCEIIYVLQGTGKVVVEDGEEKLCAGQSHYCEKGKSHSLVNDSNADLVFFAVVPEL